MQRRYQSFLAIGLAALGALCASGPVSYVALGHLSVWDGVLGVLAIVTFLILAFLAADAYLMTRDRMLLALFVAVFFWPMVSAGISLLILGQIRSGNMPWRVRMGGEGDPASVLGLLDYLVVGGHSARWGLVCMLLTNISFLIPVSMIRYRVSKSQEIVVLPGKGSKSGDTTPNSA